MEGGGPGLFGLFAGLAKNPMYLIFGILTFIIILVVIIVIAVKVGKKEKMTYAQRYPSGAPGPHTYGNPKLSMDFRGSGWNM